MTLKRKRETGVKAWLCGGNVRYLECWLTRPTACRVKVMAVNCLMGVVVPGQQTILLL